MRQRQQRIRTNNVTGGHLLHHPARHMRQRPVRLANNKHLRPCETLPLQDLHALTVARVIPIKDPPIGVVILGSMPLVRPAPGKVILLSPSPAPASAAVPEAGSSMSSIWLTSWRPKHVPDVKGAWPTICAGRTS